MQEIWKDIEGYEGLYQVSCYGRVKSLKFNHQNREGILRAGKNNTGYFQVALCKNGKLKRYLVHRLVAEAFIANPENKPHIDHINTIRTDNTVGNLRWCTAKENHSNPLTKDNRSSAQINNKIKSKVVMQFTKDKVFVAEYPSTNEASRQTGIWQTSICSCANRKLKSAGGYIWKYV